MLGLLRWFTFCVCLYGASSLESQDHASGSTINYAEVRARVAHSFPEKANEIADTISVLQDLSKATVEMADQISAHCSQ